MTHINLGFNGLEKIEDNTFGNYPKLENVNLTNNNIYSLGNNLGLLTNPETEIDLSHNNLEYLLGIKPLRPYYLIFSFFPENEFKSYIGTKKGKGQIFMTGNSLRCGCDVKWILNSNFLWDNLLDGASCKNGDELRHVSLFFIS